MTIMGAATAERLGLMRLIDRRFAGVAKGVGTGKILGRVHTVSACGPKFPALASQTLFVEP